MMRFCGAKITISRISLPHPVAVLLLDEEPAQPLRRHVRGDVGRIDALAGLVDRVPVQVGGEDLQREVLRRA